MTIEAQFFSPSLVRVLKSPGSASFTKQSLSVVQAPPRVALDIRLNGDDVVMASKSLRVALNLKTGTISYAANVFLVRERTGVGVDVTGVPDRAITYTGGEVVTDFR